MPSSARHTLRTTKAKGSPLEELVMIVAIAEPLMTLPQVIQIWTTQDVRSLSLVTWVLYVVASSIWFVYGLKIHNRALIITSSLWTIMELAVITGILIWR